MHTRKKIVPKSSEKEIAATRHIRHQRTTMGDEKKVTELITSSARKPKPAGSLLKKNRDVESMGTVNNRLADVKERNGNTFSTNGDSFNHKEAERDDPCVLDTIFSPLYHANKVVSVGDHHSDSSSGCVEDEHIDEEHCSRAYLKGALDCAVPMSNKQEKNEELTSSSYVFHKESDIENFYNNIVTVPAKSLYGEGYNVTGTLSSEVSAIYLAMQNSKLECIDEPCHDSMSVDCTDVDENEEYDDFDPYLFIRNLPDLSAVVPTFRPMLLPKQTRSCPSTSLVLDLDETLVHSSLEPCEDADFTFPVNFNYKEHTVYVRCRPFLKNFLERVSSLFEIIIFTASQSIYAEQLLNVLDPKRRLFRHRVYRESCVFVDGNYLKDLSVLGRDLSRVVIIDNSPQAFGFQVDNGIPIESWFDDPSDNQLMLLLPFLESLVGVNDVRPLIAQKFNLRDKIASAAYPSLL